MPEFYVGATQFTPGQDAVILTAVESGNPGHAYTLATSQTNLQARSASGQVWGDAELFAVGEALLVARGIDAPTVRAYDPARDVAAAPLGLAALFPPLPPPIGVGAP